MKKAEEKDVGILVRVPEASGILTGKVNADTKIDEKDHRSVRKGEWVKASLVKVEELRHIAKRNDLTITELAMKFIMTKKGFASVFPTVISEDEIINYVEMTKGQYISSSDMSEIEKIYNSAPAIPGSTALYNLCQTKFRKKQQRPPPNIAPHEVQLVRPGPCANRYNGALPCPALEMLQSINF